jgi:DNA anti-recombination protein RmuC
MILNGSKDGVPNPNDRLDVEDRYKILTKALQNNLRVVTGKKGKPLYCKGEREMTRQELIQRLTAQMKEWDAEVIKLEAKAQGATAKAEGDFQEQVDTLKQKKEEAGIKLKEIEEAAESAWEELKNGAENVFEELSNTFKSVLSKFK